MNELPNLGDLTSATLSLTLGEGAEHIQDPSECEMGGDEVWLDGAGRMPPFEEDQYFTHTLDMLATYSSGLIISRLSSGNGKLTMNYENDAKVTASSLSLTFADCSCASVEEGQWNQPGGGAFADDANWLDLEVPDENASVAFDVSGSYTVSFAESRQSSDLHITAGAEPTFALSGNTYTIDGDCGDGTVTIDGASTLTLEDGTLSASGDARLDGDGAMLFIEDQTTLTVRGTTRINAAQDDGIFVNAGGSLSATGDVLAGEERGMTGLISVTGAGFSAPHVVLGQSGEGTLELEDQATGLFDRLTAGQNSSGEGTISVTGARTELIATDVVVGDENLGELEVTDQARASVIALTAGAAIASDGLISVTGAMTALTAETVVVGDEGVGKLELKEQATATITDLTAALKAGAGSPDEVTITKATLGVDFARIGVAGEAILSVEDLGLLTADIVNLGFEADGQGTLEVTGPGAMAQLNMLAVGNQGTGFLKITDGATVEALDAFAGLQAGFGDIFIEGAGSSLEVAGTLCLGCQSAATANLLLLGGSFGRIGTLHLGMKATVNATGGTLNIGQTIPPASGSKAAQERPTVTVDTLLATSGAMIEVDTVVVYPGGVLAGDYAWPFHITNGGKLSPGLGTTTETFTAAAGYTQTAEGTLEIKLKNTNRAFYDQLEVTGTAKLGGRLVLTLIDDFVPRPGQEFEIIRADAIEGHFAEVESHPQVAFDVSYSERAVTATVVTVTSIEDGEALPTSFELSQNYPNPFTPRTVIGYALPRSERVRLVIYDGLGREVAVLYEGMQEAGRHEAVFAAEGLPSGVYLYRLEAGTFTQTRRLAFIR